jgi:outer membrane biosynthesis protein TonB
MSKYKVVWRKTAPYNLKSGDVVIAQPGRILIIDDADDNSADIIMGVKLKKLVRIEEEAPPVVRKKVEEEKEVAPPPKLPVIEKKAAEAKKKVEKPSEQPVEQVVEPVQEVKEDDAAKTEVMDSEETVPTGSW